MQELLKNELSKIIINTRFGAIPFLNDSLVSSFKLNFFNIKLSDLKNYFEVFEKFKSQENRFYVKEKSALNQFFNLDFSYLTFLDHKDFNDSLGIGEENALFYISITGKSKITFQDYLKITDILEPNLVLIPFEYVSTDCSSKRLERSLKKISKFVELTSKTGKKNYICPLFLYHLKYFNVNYLNRFNNITGFTFILEDYKKLSFEKVLNYKESIMSLNLGEDILKIKCGTGHPIDLLIGILIGCNKFEVSFPFDISEKALSIQSDFDFEILFEENWEKKLDDKSLDSLDIKYNNLKEKSFSEDNSILKEGCKCFTCSNNYTRAYIHHLLICNEINATILLIMHNIFFVIELIKRFEKESNKKLYFYQFLMTQCENTKINK